MINHQIWYDNKKCTVTPFLKLDSIDTNYVIGLKCPGNTETDFLNHLLSNNLLFFVSYWRFVNINITPDGTRLGQYQQLVIVQGQNYGSW